MGAVYEATDTTTEQVVAVRVVTADVAKNAQLLSRFEREVNAARGLNTPTSSASSMPDAIVIQACPTSSWKSSMARISSGF